MKKYGLRRGIPVAFLLSAAFSLMLAGCGDGGGGASSANPGVLSAQAQAAAEEPALNPALVRAAAQAAG